MKTLEFNKTTILNFNSNALLLEKKGQVLDLKIIDYEVHPETCQTTLVLYSEMFTNDNYKLIVRNNQIALVIMEHIEFNRPIYVHHYNWQNYQTQAYDRFHSASILLPGERYHLISHQFIPGQNLLKISLGNLSEFN